MKIVIIGDIHGNPLWKQIIDDQPDAGMYVFIGDYFDSFDIPTDKQCQNFADIIEFKKSNESRVELLIGNHDLPYFMKEDQGVSGYQAVGKYLIEPLVYKNKHYLTACYTYSNLIFTHAGISEVWLNNHFTEEGWDPTDAIGLEYTLNSALHHTPEVYKFDGWDAYGENVTQTPVWIRPKTLMRASKNIKAASYIQIVGHTRMHKIDVEGKSTGGKYFFIDTLNSPSHQYLVWQDGVFTTHTVTTENYK